MRRGLSISIWAPLAYGATEFGYPRIFQDYLANVLHGQPLAMQVVDLGGPGLLSLAVVLVNGAAHQLLQPARAWQLRPTRALLAACALTWAAILGYGAYRIDEVQGRMDRSEKLTVGIVQANADLCDKHKQRRK